MELFDPACLRLAEHFLEDDDTNTLATAGVHHKRVESLAEAIYQAVEDWVQDEADRDEATA